jgi:hypothetical protein
MFAFDLLFLDGIDLRREPLCTAAKSFVRSPGPIYGLLSSSMTIMRVTEPSCSSRPAPWAWKALSQSEHSALIREDPQNFG